MVVIHPGRGIAVLDVEPSATPDAVGAVRARLDAARFDAIFAGYLPVVHVQATSRQTATLASLLDDAFAAAPPLELPGGDAWARVAARALLAEQTAPRPERHPAPPRVTAAAVEDGPRQRQQPRRRHRAGRWRTVGAVLLCLSALGGVVALLLKELPVPDPAALGVPAASPPTEGADARRDAAATAPAIGRPASPGTAPAAPPLLPPQSDRERTTTLVPQAPPPVPTPPDGDASAPGSPQRGAPATRRPEAQPTPPRARPPERAASPPPRRQQDAGADTAPAGGASSAEAPSQRCGRVAARIGSGGPLSETDMRYFNEACIRW